jgi:outer membrane receptor protein involved in Fe transport
LPKKIRITSSLALLVYSAVAFPQNTPNIEEVVVFGRNTELLGRAESASQGSVGGADLLVRPMLKVAELLESMPGMVAVQHSGSGKANQYFLRGFNLDHGTDYSAYIDGMPWNLRSHGHGQGYLDVNGMLPESVERIDYRKGPYYADLGDFSVAGASFIKTVDQLEHSFVSAEIGQYQWQRVAGGVSQEIGDGVLTVIGEAKSYDGPWRNSEGLKHISVWSKYRQDTTFGEAAFTLSAYSGDWHPTEQIPERAIGSDVCPDAFCSLDSSAQGNTERWIGTANLIGSDWKASAYGQYYDWTMESNPTYDNQINQFDRRWTVGGRANKTIFHSETLEFAIGGEARHDDIADVGLDQHDGGIFVSNISDNSIVESSMGVYGETKWSATERLRVLASLRYDYYNFDVTANNANSFGGKKADSQASPKLGLAYLLNQQMELYANWGKGFHSNDARGVVNIVKPVSGLSEGIGYETGLRTSLGDLKLTASYWWLNQDSELIFVGDSNSVEPKGGSKREGYELTAFWQAFEGVGVDAVYTQSAARYTDNPDGSHVEGSVEQSAQLGIAVVRDSWEGSLRARYLGPYAMTADNLQRAESLTTVSMRAAYHWQKVTVYAEVINLLDTDRKEIVYFYPAFAAGFDSNANNSDDIDCEQVNCRMSRVTEPQSFRVGLSVKF